MASLYSINGGSRTRPASREEVRELEAEAWQALERLVEVMPTDDFRRLPLVAVMRLLEPIRPKGGA
jgi:hypothetical protein